ncbi:hypothetical protein AX17_005660 [Amanita inopinata Kibby_2008]|nr:hypothetical protein AX17_005660 [Amanita inopinata Kibby_2008]
MMKVTLSYGPMLIGTFVNMILFGILIVQTYFYFTTYKKDVPWLKYLVLYLFIVETVNTGCDIAMMYQPLILEYGQAEATKYFPIMFASEPIIIVAVSTPIQLFLALRIRLLTGMNWIPLIISLFALVSLAGGIWTTVMIVLIKTFVRKPELHHPALVWFLASCVSDILITGVLVVSLSKRKTGFTATDDAISKLIRMTVQTGLLTSLFAIGDVVFFLTLPHTALNFLWDLALSKLYANCLMSTLNARAALQNLGSGHSHQRHVTSSATPRRRPFESLEIGEHEHVESSVYELEAPKPFDATSPYEIGYGITVTKVVETLQDPTPRSRETQ